MTNAANWLDQIYTDYDNWKSWSPDLQSAQEARLIEIELEGAASGARA